MKKAALVYLIVLICFLCGCNGSDNSEKGSIVQNDTNEDEYPILISGDERNIIYLNAIEKLENTGYLPDGNYCYVDNGIDFEEQKKQAYSNEFVIYDINDDGIDELLIRVEGTCNSDSAQYIYCFSEEKENFELLFEYYYGCSFYENGLIYAPVSHSGYMYNDDFWPYEIYKYNRSENIYECIASVEQLDLTMCPEYVNSFPFEYDKDGDNKIYFVHYYEKSLYMDEEEYRDWKEKLLDSNLIELDWNTLN